MSSALPPMFHEFRRVRKVASMSSAAPEVSR